MAFFGNEMHCLTNAVTQHCMRHELLVTQAVPPILRRLCLKHKIDHRLVSRVELHQRAHDHGFVEYYLAVEDTAGHIWDDRFQGSGLSVDDAAYVLYDRARDGTVEYLHLQH